MRLESILDKNTKLLLKDLRTDFQIEFEQKDINYCGVYTLNNQATIYYNPKHVTKELIAHELLHVKLYRYNYDIGTHIYLSCKSHAKLRKVFKMSLCGFISNCTDHLKMYPEYIEMGYSPAGFLTNGFDEKCRLKEIKYLNFSIINTYKAKSIERYIGYLISIFADQVDINYFEHLKLLQEKDSDLFEIISKLWKKWEEFDIKNIDPIYNSDIDLANSFITDMEKWIENKIIK